MSMKKFLNHHKKNEDDLNDTTNVASSSNFESRQSISSVGSNNSIKEIEMFDDNKIKNDAKLNLNPSILNSVPLTSGSRGMNDSSASIFTKDSATINNKSLFSNSKKTMSTNQSSYFSKKSSSEKLKSKQPEFGQRLQILDIKEEELSSKNPHDSLFDKLLELCNDLSFIMNQFNNSNSNLTTSVINSIDCFKKFTNFVEELKTVDNEDNCTWNFDTYNNSSLRKIMKIYLNFYDNLLQDDVYIKLKLLLVRNFNDFVKTLDSSNSKRFSVNNPSTIIKPQNFAIGCNPESSLPNEDILINIINKMSSTSIKIKEQNGSFIAPIVRGVSKNLNILCLYFGYPNPTDYHLKLTQTLHDLYDDIHVVVVKNRIDLAAAQVSSLPNQIPTQMPTSNPNTNVNNNNNTTSPQSIQKFKLPFRVPTDVTKPPMALSISIENASRTSGTMGGYIYPMIDTEKQPHLESYANSKFAISCGHVCLNNTDDQTEYPHVSAPSSVLISLYKKALTQQYEKLSQLNQSTMMEAKVAYGSVLKQVDKMFPLKKVKLTTGKASKEDHYEIRNLPIHRFGQIIWGERTLMSIKETNEKKLSDLAIIKVNKNLTCDQNFLGDDIAFNEFDPGLMFDNLYVRKVIDLNRISPKDNADALDLNVDEVDDEVPSNNKNQYAGLPVFKYGSTTKFTQGNLNGIKLVYWLDGAIHSSEFVINSIDNNTAFAAGGDSGSWILTKLEDCANVSPAKGLGVLGMLHSYDGEFRQFGLFTPMCEILERLEQVTKIKWGVVGVAEKDVSKLPNEVDSDKDYGSEIESVSSLSDDESDIEGSTKVD